MRRAIYYLFILTLISSCHNDNDNRKNNAINKNDCLQSVNHDNSEYFRQPYIKIDSTISTDTGCIYIASTYIFLDSIYTRQILLRKNDRQLLAKTIQPESKEFVLFNFNQPINKRKKIAIQYQDSLIQNFECGLENKICMKNSDTAFVFKIEDFYYYYHDGIEFTSSLDVVFFITEQNGIIGSYLTDDTNDSTEIFISPGGNILKDYVDYSSFKEMKLQ